MNDTDNYNPCLPILFTAEQDITITFDADNINDLSDWYPKELCQNQTYVNQYMFDGAGSLTITNLIINDYTIRDDSYALIRTSNENYNATVKCIDCRFRNIETTSGVDRSALLYTYSNIILIGSEFVNISISHVYLICAGYVDDADRSDETPRLISIEQTIYQNIATHVHSMLYIAHSDHDVK